MKPVNIKDRCTKKCIKKCEEVVRLYDEIQLAYAIGVANPLSVMVDTFGTSEYDAETLAKAVTKVFDLRPAAIIRDLDLRRPIYRSLAAYGHMGREDLNAPWEARDLAEQLKR